MAKRNRTPTIQVFIVSWFPIYAREAAKIQCILAGFGERLGLWTYAGPGWWCQAAALLGLRMKDARQILSAAGNHL